VFPLKCSLVSDLVAFFERSLAAIAAFATYRYKLDRVADRSVEAAKGNVRLFDQNKRPPQFATCATSEGAYARHTHCAGTSARPKCRGYAPC